MPHAGGLSRAHEIAPRGLEERQDGFVREIRSVRDVDDDLGAGKSFGKPHARDGVNARAGRRRDDIMALLTQIRSDFAADEAGAADDNDLHGSVLLGSFSMDTKMVDRGRKDFVAPSKLP